MKSEKEILQEIKRVEKIREGSDDPDLNRTIASRILALMWVIRDKDKTL